MTDARLPHGAVPWGRRIGDLARAHPDKPAIIFAPDEAATERVVTWAELERRSNQVARLMAERAPAVAGPHAPPEARRPTMVVVGLKNTPEHYVATIAAWKLGACALPISPRQPPRERDGLIEVADARLVVGEWDDLSVPTLTPADLEASRAYPDDALPDRVPDPGKAIPSGGSTGRSKVIINPGPWARVPGFSLLRDERPVSRPGQVQLVPGALYHNTPFSWSHMGLFEDQTLVLMERFDAARAVDLIERYRVQFMPLVPTMMRRIVQLPRIRERDLSSVECIFHTAAACPPWVKRAWIELIGPERVFEGFGSSEALGSCRNWGDEWLAKPGTVGRPTADTELKILDEQGRELPPGQVGEIFMRRRGPDSGRPAAETYYYLGSPPAKATPDGFASVGDMGWVDDDGYLFLADRRVDLIISGGANIYPAEVEAALTEHPAVADVVVIGVPDEDWGKRVHALIHPRDPESPPPVDGLDAHCRERLAPYKVPKTYEFTGPLPRDEAGKIRRTALAAERAAPDWRGQILRPGRDRATSTPALGGGGS